MKNTKTLWSLLCVVLLVLAVVTGCSGGNASNRTESGTNAGGNAGGGSTDAGTNTGANAGNNASADAGNNAGSEPAEKIKLTVYVFNGTLTDEEFQRNIVEPATAKFPNLEFEVLRGGPDLRPEDLIAAGDFPDITFTGMRTITQFSDLNIPLQLDEYVQKHNLDLGVYHEAAVKTIQSFSPDGSSLLALPLRINTRALFYNKDVFDRFAVPYPQDNMTWDDVIRLSKQLTREEGGVQYRGVVPPAITEFSRGLSLPYVDKASEKSAVNTDQWKRVFELTKQVYESAVPEIVNWGASEQLFLKDKVVGMLPWYAEGLFAQIGEMEKQGDTFNWDLTTFPAYPESPGETVEMDLAVYIVSSTSKHKDIAFQVISHLTTSEELMIQLARTGTIPALKLDNIESIFGQDVPALQGKNIAGLFKAAYREAPPATPYDTIARQAVSAAFTEYLNGQVDVNTALRQADEKINQTIEQQRAK